MQPVADNLKRLSILVRACTMNTWTPEWPQTPGRYWFFGVRSSYPPGFEPRLWSVDVQITANGVRVYLAEGVPLRSDIGAQGVWQPALLPGLPKSEVT